LFKIISWSPASTSELLRLPRRIDDFEILHDPTRRGVPAGDIVSRVDVGAKLTRRPRQDGVEPEKLFMFIFWEHGGFKSPGMLHWED